MRNKVSYFFYSFSILLGIMGYCWHRLGDPHPKKVVKNHRQVPTLFIHGYLGNRASFGVMMHRFTRYGWGQKSAVMRITKEQTLVVKGDPTLNDGFIQILFTDNRHCLKQQAQWLWQILSVLKNKYGVKKVNLVAHSMGAVAVMQYLSLYGDDLQVAQINKIVSLGAPYNDFETGKTTRQIENLPLTKNGPTVMTPLYQFFKQRSDRISPRIKFLNIMGDLGNGTASDGAVSLNSAASLRFLLQNYHERYEELIIRGKKAAHSRLHENQEIDQKIGQFLFEQS